MSRDDVTLMVEVPVIARVFRDDVTLMVEVPVSARVPGRRDING